MTNSSDIYLGPWFRFSSKFDLEYFWHNVCNDSRIKESFFEYYKLIISIGAWSNPINLEGLYDRFVHAPTEIIIIFLITYIYSISNLYNLKQHFKTNILFSCSTYNVFLRDSANTVFQLCYKTLPYYIMYLVVYQPWYTCFGLGETATKS